jgi:HAD superfamily hydrolase (TIGR01549 family)
MRKSNQIKIISIDLFRTLIDVQPTIEDIWHMFLKEDFPDEVSGKYYRRADEILARRWDAAGIHEKEFKNVREILVDTYTEFFKETNLDYNPELFANAMIECHHSNKYFYDVKPFLESIGRKYPVCLSTDADTEMVENIQTVFPFDSVFISEEIGAYKLNPAFFNNVISHYNVLPGNILHIGDSKSDVFAPQQLGMQTCWLNRHNKKWEYDIKPDFEVKSLLEIVDLLL